MFSYILRFVEFICFLGKLFGTQVSAQYISELSKGHIFLVEAKRQGANLDLGVPEAIGQALAWSQITGFVLFFLYDMITKASPAKQQ